MLAALPAGCDGCGKDKPYTPFGVASGSPAPSASAPEDAGAAEPDARAERPRFVPRMATTTPERATRFTFDGREVEAPAGRAFERGLSADFDGDGAKEVVSWTVPLTASPQASPGELWLHPAKGAAKKLGELPGFVPTGPACKLVPALAQTGPKSVTLDVTGVCSTTLLERAPARGLVVVAPLAERPVVLTLRAAYPAKNEPFELEVDSADRDGDGRDDVRLVVTQKPVCRIAPQSVPSGCPTDKEDKSASAQVIWFDRAQGASRDATEPAASLGLLAQVELSRSKKKGAGALVSKGVAQVRRLTTTLCAEGSTARVFEAEGAMLRCAPLVTLAERLLTAEVQAALADKDALAALAALERDGWYFGRASDKRKAELEKSVLAEAVGVEPKETSPKLEVAARPGTPRLSPLAFEATGALLAQTPSGLVRVSEAGTTEAVDADSGLAAWPLVFSTKNGRRLENLVFPCDRSDVHPYLVEIGRPYVAVAPTSLLAPRPGACGGGGKLPTPSVVVLGEKDDLPALLVGGQSLGPHLGRAELALRPRVLGGPSSPDGRVYVVPTSRGLWLEGPDKPELWKVSDPRSLGDCTAADGGKAVACVAGTAVKIFRK